MPRISTDNYDTVASWNGSQDLFIVEQPDGTKVATPAMVKQFIEAGDFEATGEIKDGHGNILKDMAKASDVNTLIGDLSGTGLTGDSVADQLGDANEQIDILTSGITVIPRKVLSANNEDDFLSQVFADIKADTATYASNLYYATINRIYGWLGTNTYIVYATRPSGKWINALVYAYDRLYVIEYNCDTNAISTKKTATLT